MSKNKLDTIVDRVSTLESELYKARMERDALLSKEFNEAHGMRQDSMEALLSLINICESECPPYIWKTLEGAPWVYHVHAYDGIPGYVIAYSRKDSRWHVFTLDKDQEVWLEPRLLNAIDWAEQALYDDKRLTSTQWNHADTVLRRFDKKVRRMSYDKKKKV